MYVLKGDDDIPLIQNIHYFEKLPESVALCQKVLCLRDSIYQTMKVTAECMEGRNKEYHRQLSSVRELANVSIRNALLVGN